MTDTPKRGRGRPRSDDPRTKVITIRVTPEQLGAIESAAATEDKTPAAWLRDAALATLGIDGS